MDRSTPAAAKSEFAWMLFRVVSITIAIITGVLGLWIITPELIRLDRVDNATYSFSQSTQAKWAAWIGLVRGQLWTEYGLDSLNGFVEPEATDEQIQTARDAAERAVRLAPHDARAWLLFARSDTGSSRRDFLAASLKMSYYTGPNALSIIAPRLLLVARTPVSDDPELRELLQREVQKILTATPDLKPAIIAAYRKGSPEAKLAIEQAVSDVDQGFLAELKSDATEKEKPSKGDRVH